MISHLLFAAAAAASAYCTPQPGLSAEEAVDRYISAYNAHDLGRVQLTYSESVRVHVWRMTGEGDRYQLSEVLGGMSDFFAQNPSVQVSYSQRSQLGPRLSQVESYTSGQAALVVYTVVDGCVTARDTYW